MNIENLRGQVAVALVGRGECHGFNHALCVEKLAQKIFAATVRDCEDIDSSKVDDYLVFVLETGRDLSRQSAIISAIALLHDVWDHKFVFDPKEVKRQWAINLIRPEIGFDSIEVEVILDEIDRISFSKGETPKSLYGRIVQDADRITGSGAIGVLRCATYNAAKGNNFTEVTDHLQEKFLNSGMKMNTHRGQQFFNESQNFLRAFLAQYREEMDYGSPVPVVSEDSLTWERR